MLRQLLHKKRSPSLCSRPNLMEEKNRRDALLAAVRFGRAAHAARAALATQPRPAPAAAPSQAPAPVAPVRADHLASFRWAHSIRNKPPDTPTRRAPDQGAKRPSIDLPRRAPPRANHHATGIAAAIQQQQQQQQQQLQQLQQLAQSAAYYRQQAGLRATSAAIPAAPSQDEVAIVGYRSRQERDAEARRHAIDVDSESETTPGKRPACAAEVAARPAQPVAKLIAKPAVRLRAKPVAKPAARPATRLAARQA